MDIDDVRNVYPVVTGKKWVNTYETALYPPASRRVMQDGIDADYQILACCYLIASAVTAAEGGEKLSESLGDYSYTLPTPVTGVDKWMDRYLRLIPSEIVEISNPSVDPNLWLDRTPGWRDDW